MVNARRKLDDEPGARSAVGIRVARERMRPGTSAVVETPKLLETPSHSQAPLIMLPPRSDGRQRDGALEPDWMKAATPESSLRFSGSDIAPAQANFPSRAFAFSALAHAALLAIAIVAFPKTSEFPEGGENAIPVEMVIVAPDSADAAGTESGAKPEVTEVNVPLPEQSTEAVTIPLPEVAVILPDAAPPVHIEVPALQAEIPEAPAPAIAMPDMLPPVPISPDGILPKRSEPAALLVPPKPRPAVDQDRIRRDAATAKEARRQQELREEQRQAQIAERRKQQAQRAVADAQRRASAEVARPAPSPQRSVAQGQGDAGTGTDRRTQQARQAGGGSQGAAASAGTAEIASYRSRILAHLARYKTYPDSAQEAGIQGRATVSFTITRSGGVSSASLSGSSGVGVLDQATLAMVRRAQPFPAMPAGSPASMSFTAVIRYDLR